MIAIKTGEVFTNHKGERCIVLKMYAPSKKGAYYVVWFPETCQYQIIHYEQLVGRKFYDQSKPYIRGVGYSKGTLENPSFTSGNKTESGIYHKWLSMLSKIDIVNYIGEIKIYDKWLNYMIFRKWFIENTPMRFSNSFVVNNFLVGDGRYYSPSTCVTIPQKLHSCLTTHRYHNNLRITKDNRINELTEHYKDSLSQKVIQRIHEIILPVLSGQT